VEELICRKPSFQIRQIFHLQRPDGAFPQSEKYKKDMAEESIDIQGFLERAREGDQSAIEELFKRYRGRLRKAIAMRIDRRLAARVDASDVLQETYLEAFRRLPKYLSQEEMPFYLWLHWIAREKVLALHRRHLGAGKRAVTYEAPLLPADTSATFVSAVIAGREPSPSQALAKTELAERLRQAMGQLDDDERDLILWRHFEQLSARDMAQLMKISEAAASKRYIRAVERLRTILIGLGVSKPG
jgi:RNA polymerase sigma-70 factor (ECF subfamily)